jgi:hypothetical protein
MARQAIGRRRFEPYPLVRLPTWFSGFIEPAPVATILPDVNGVPILARPVLKRLAAPRVVASVSVLKIIQLDDSKGTIRIYRIASRPDALVAQDGIEAIDGNLDLVNLIVAGDVQGGHIYRQDGQNGCRQASGPSRKSKGCDPVIGDAGESPDRSF